MAWAVTLGSEPELDEAEAEAFGVDAACDPELAEAGELILGVLWLLPSWKLIPVGMTPVWPFALITPKAVTCT